jgi:hypothetical protein
MLEHWDRIRITYPENMGCSLIIFSIGALILLFFGQATTLTCARNTVSTQVNCEIRHKILWSLTISRRNVENVQSITTTSNRARGQRCGGVHLTTGEDEIFTWISACNSQRPAAFASTVRDFLNDSSRPLATFSYPGWYTANFLALFLLILVVTSFRISVGTQLPLSDKDV